MMEAEWLSATDPTPMLGFLRGKASDRKLRLFAVACERRRLLPFEARERAGDVAERFVDGGGSARELKAAYADVYKFTRVSIEDGFMHATLQCTYGMGVEQRRAEQVEFLRDIIGNPFRPVTVDPSWLSSTAVAIAQGIYDDKAFDRLPILADALQDAGCENADMLTHLRSHGPHVRGCWALDLVLGKQ